jgi:hypothetical protein
MAGQKTIFTGAICTYPHSSGYILLEDNLHKFMIQFKMGGIFYPYNII